MHSTRVDIQPVLDELRAGLHKLYGDRLKDIILYGSFARGEAHPESDIDIVVVLRGPVDPMREIERMGHLRAELNLTYGELVSAFPISDTDYLNAKDIFWRNVKREGIAV